MTCPFSLDQIASLSAPFDRVTVRQRRRHAWIETFLVSHRSVRSAKQHQGQSMQVKLAT
jgi:hypothetical protein